MTIIDLGSVETQYTDRSVHAFRLRSSVQQSWGQMMPSSTNGDGSMRANCVTSMRTHHNLLLDMFKLGPDERWQEMGSHNLGFKNWKKNDFVY